MQRNSIDWTPSEVADKLETLGLGSYRDIILNNYINGEVLGLLQEKHLKELGIKSIGHRITFLQFIKNSSSFQNSTSKVIESNNYETTKKKETKLKYEPEPEPLPKQKPKSKQIPQEIPEDDYYADPNSYKKIFQEEEIESKPVSANSDWERKRRQALLKKMNSNSDLDTQSEKKRNEYDHSSTSTIQNSKNKSSNKYYENEEPQQKIKYNPNPFSRDEEDPNFQQTTSIKKQQPKPKQQPQQPPPTKSFPPQKTQTINQSKFKNSIPSDNEDNYEDNYTPPPLTKNSFNPPPENPDDDPDDRQECSYCGRKFASDRINKHEETCARAHSKKTKVFDSSKMRLAGTEAAQFASKSKHQPEPVIKKSNYKEQHQQLVDSLRAARKLQKYEQDLKEGKAVGPPPEIPKFEIQNDDRIVCPICGRKFVKEAAEKHIPVCERMKGGGGRMVTSNTTKKPPPKKR